QFLLQMQQAFQHFNLVLPAVLGQLQISFGPAQQALLGAISIQPPQQPLSNRRRVASAKVLRVVHGWKGVTKKFTVKKGKKVVFPKLGKVPAGTYAVTVTLNGANGAPVTVVTPTFTLNAQGKLVKSLKPAKKAKPKHKTKASHKAKAKPTHKAKKS